MADDEEGARVTARDTTVSGMPGRYATALFELAGETRETEAVGAQLAAFQSLLDQSDDLKRLVRSPVFSAEDQIGALDAIFAKANLTGLAGNFIKLAAANRRLFAVGQMIKDYLSLMAADRGEVRAEVTSAEPLSDTHVSELKAALKAQTGRDVLLSQRLDESILGGLIVKVGSRMVDNSLRTKLQNLKIAMKGTG